MKEQCIYLIWGKPDEVNANKIASEIPESSIAYWFLGDFSLPEQVLAHPRVRILRITSSLHPRAIRVRGYRRYEYLQAGPLGAQRRNAATFLRNFDAWFTGTWKNNPTLLVLGNRLIGNLARNLSFFQSRTIATSEVQSSRPVFLLGAGPTLSEAMTILETKRSEFYLLSVDTALPSLFARSILPDGIFILESQYWNSHDFLPLRRSLLAEFKGDLFFDLTSLPGILRLFPNAQMRPFLSRFSQEVFLGELQSLGVPLLPALGNVGAAALYLAKSMSKQNIRVAGFDFGTRRAGELLLGGHHHLWILSKQTRLKQPGLGPMVRSGEVYASHGAERDHELFVEVAQSMPGKVKVEYSARGARILDGPPHAESGVSSGALSLAVQIDFQRAVLLLRDLCRECRSTLTADTDSSLQVFLRGRGSIFALSAPIGISEAAREKILPYVQQSLYTLERGLGMNDDD